MANMTLTTEEFYQEVHALRGVQTPCPGCSGLGVKLYGSTATWRGGIGGAAMTNDVCDECWGSGDAERPWPSHRLLGR